VGRASARRDAARHGHDHISFTTSDGLTLAGWYVPSKNGPAVISFPGRAGSQKPARVLARHGYGVLVFDRRGEGESEGEPNAFGWGGDRDIRPRSSSCSTGPTWTPSGSAASASRSAAS
jgi:predicted acyl esterase